MPKPVIDITGQKFAKLSVTGFAGYTPNHEALWHCLCDCGKQAVMRGHALRSGQKRSCGCSNRRPGRPPGEVGKLAKREGITRQAAWFRLRKASGKPAGRPIGSKNRPIDARTRQAIKRRYLDGESMENVGRHLHVSMYTLRRVLVAEGVKIRMPNKHKPK
jgi:hypothetical protein